MRICQVCRRQAGGFGFIRPPLNASDPVSCNYRKYFCSMNCQRIYSNLFKKNNMIYLTRMEKDAIESALKPLAKYISEIGINKSFAQYSREEVLCFIEIAVTSYWNFMQNLPCD